MSKNENGKRVLDRLMIVSAAVTAIWLSNAWVHADPVDPSVKNIAQYFSHDIQVNFELYADTDNPNLVWYSQRYGSIALNSQLDPDFSVDVNYPLTGIFAGHALVDLSGSLDTSGIVADIIHLDREAKAQGFDIAPIQVESVETTFLVGGFPVGNSGRIDAECDNQIIDTPFGPVSVPFCQARDKNGVMRSLDFLYDFESSPPAGGTSVSQHIPFAGTSLPGWEYPIRELMAFGQSWDHLFQVVTNWTIKADASVDVARISVTWPVLFKQLASYFAGCEWACKESEVNFLYEAFLQAPSKWGLTISYRQKDGTYGTLPISQDQRLQTKNKLIDILGPELFVSFVDEVIVPELGEVKSIGTLAKASASSTFCSGSYPSLHCYSPARANDGSTDTSLGGLSSWSNAGGPLPQWLELNWLQDYLIHEVDVYTSEGYAISDFDIEVFDEGSGRWETIAVVTNNKSLKISAFEGRVNTRRLRVLARRGPSNQYIYTRINEIVVRGQARISSVPTQQTFYTLRSNIQKLLLAKPEIIQLSSGDPEALRTSSTLMYLQCMTGGFGLPVSWSETPNCGYSATTNVATLAVASASSTYCSSPNSPAHCYDPARVNDGSTSTKLGGQSSWANARSPSLPQWLQLAWPSRIKTQSITAYTSENYEIQDFDIQYFDDLSQDWITVKEIRGNEDVVIQADFAEVTTSKIRVLGLRGPESQTTYVRLNELVVEGRPE